MAMSMSRLHTRWAVSDKPQYNSHPKLVAHDESLISSLKQEQDRMSRSLAHSKSFLRIPLGKLCNLHVGSVISDVSGAWSHVRKCDLAIPAQSSYPDAILLSTAVGIQHTEPEQTSTSTIPHPGDITTHPAVARTLQTFRAELPKKITWAEKIPAPRSPIVRPSKRPRTPFPVAEMDRQPNAPEDEARSLSPKRLRTSLRLPSVDVPFLAPRAVVSGKGGQTNLHHLVRWLSGYLYLLVSNPDRSYSWVPSLVDFSAKEATMDKIMDILGHYGPNNSIIFLALWYLVRLFPKPLVMSEPVLEHDATVELISRAFLLGLLIANKWLNDFTMPLKDWCQFCTLPLLIAQDLERSALKVLDHNISISNTDWVSWLFEMRASASCYPPAYGDHVPVVAIVNDLLKAGPKVSRPCARPKPIARPTSFELSFGVYSKMVWGLRVFCWIYEPRSVRAICEPAPWNPAEDPIVPPLTDRRTNGTAPGAPPYTTTAPRSISTNGSTLG